MTTPSRPELDAWIDPAWGQWVHDNLPTVFPSLAAAKAEFPAPRDGQQVFLTDESSLIVGKGGTWRWWNKTYPYVTGNTAYLSWQSGTAPASSSSSLTINARSATVTANVSMFAPATSGSMTMAVMVVGFRPAARVDAAAAAMHGSGAGSARSAIYSTGELSGFWAATNNPTAVTSILTQITYPLPDLTPA